MYLIYFRFVIDPINKVAFKDIAKIGSTTWLHIMSTIAVNHTRTINDNIIHGNDIERYGLYRKMYTPTEAEDNLTGFTKFVVVRNPLHRIVSGYQNKIVSSKPAGYRNALKQFLNMNLSSERIPSFQGFVKMILSKTGLASDLHFANYFMDINPCLISYQYILKLETHNTDLKCFLPQIYKIENYKSYMNLHRNMHSKHEFMTEVYLEEYTYLNAYLIKSVMEKFQYESEFFGYGFDMKKSVAQSYF